MIFGHIHDALTGYNIWEFNMDYILKRSSRKTISIEVTPELDIIVRAPRCMPMRLINEYVTSKEDWILGTYRKIEKRNQSLSHYPKLTDADIRSLTQKAKAYIPKRVAYYAPIIGVTCSRISIRNQTTRWGSCSSKGNLNFNCKLMLTPDEIIDYVVVHELCHRIHMNHSPAFWAEVERIIPDYKNRRRWLKENGPMIR